MMQQQVPRWLLLPMTHLPSMSNGQSNPKASRNDAYERQHTSVLTHLTPPSLPPSLPTDRRGGGVPNGTRRQGPQGHQCDGAGRGGAAPS